MTGGNGFVGGHLRQALGGGSTESTVLVAGREPECDIALDLADPASVESAVRSVRPDLVIHLAGEASVAAAAKDAAETWRINVVGTLALATAFGEVSPEGGFFFTSSAEVYGAAFLDGPASETTPSAPTSVYGETKLAAERLLAAVLPQAARLVTVRPSNHFGPGQDARFALPSFARQIAEGERAGGPVSIRVGNLDAARDFMDVRDVVRAYVALLDLPRAAGARDTYNVASGVTHSVGELLDMLRARAVVATGLVIDPQRQRANEIPVAAVDAGLLRSATGWMPAFPVEASIADILGDARRNLRD